MSDFEIKVLQKWLLTLLEQELSNTNKAERICIAITELTKSVTRSNNQ